MRTCRSHMLHFGRIISSRHSQISIVFVFANTNTLTCLHTHTQTLHRKRNTSDSTWSPFVWISLPLPSKVKTMATFWPLIWNIYRVYPLSTTAFLKFFPLCLTSHRFLCVNISIVQSSDSRFGTSFSSTSAFEWWCRWL